VCGVLVLAMIVAGCIRVEVATTVGEDGSGELRYAQLLGPELQEFAEESGEPFDCAEFNEDMPDNAELSEVTDGEYSGCQAVIPFADIGELNDLAPNLLTDGDSGFTTFRVTEGAVGFAFAAAYVSGESVQDDELDDFSFGTAVLSLQLPGTVLDHDADEVTGDVLTWRIPLEDSRTLSAVTLTESIDNAFTDITGNVHEAAILWVAGEGIATGFGDGRFGPNDDVTRGQMATFLSRALDLPPGTATFTDIDGNTHADAIRAVAEAGISEGRGDGTFGPDEPVTRGQMATFLTRALDLAPGAATFPDVDPENVHAPGISAVAEAGITSGFADGTFGPSNPVTRGQMATFLFNALAE
jgi:hypothetical protein